MKESEKDIHVFSTYHQSFGENDEVCYRHKATNTTRAGKHVTQE